MKLKRPSIHALNLPLWAYRTASADIYFHSRLNRPPRKLSWRAIRAFVNPNLNDPVFVIGAARSGTTFLGNCLGQIPEISYHHEPVATKAASRFVYTGEWTEDRAARFYRLVYRWLMRIHIEGDLRFAEKTPRNSTHVGFFVRNFPGAQFLHIIRDGRAAALSMSKQPWLSAARLNSNKTEYGPGGNPFGPFARVWVEPDRIAEFESTSDVHRGIWAWKRFTELGIEGLKQAPPDKVLRLRYEDLVVNPDRHSDRILDFLGIRAPASRDAFRRGMRKAQTASIDQWRKDLSAGQLQEIEREAGELLRQLGYLD